MESGKVPRGASGISMEKEGSEHFKELPPRRDEIKAEISEGILKPVATTIVGVNEFIMGSSSSKNRKGRMRRKARSERLKTERMEEYMATLKYLTIEMRNATLEDPRKEDMETISTASIETSCAEVCSADLEYEALFPVYLDRCFLYCSLFPLAYEFEKDTLVQLWIAQDFIEAEGTERMEDTGSRYFDELFSMKLIVPSRFDGFIDDLKYKLSDAAASCHMSYEEISTGNHLRVEDGKLSDASARTLHLSLLCEDIDQMAFEAIQKCEHLRTLLLLREYRSRVKQVPREIFLKLRFLRTLDLSRTHISELPSSIGNVKLLRYLDVSETLIKLLPDSLDCLYNLQTLKLRGCLDLVGLPKGMMKLTNLRHLDLDIIRQLISMPKGMGNLTSLQTLHAFLVDREDGCRIVELKNMNYLSGAFCISRLENVLNSEEAKEAALSDKQYIDKLELRWSDLRNEEAVKEEEVLEFLQPHSGLKELEILFYRGSKLPSWISNPSFAMLANITF